MPKEKPDTKNLNNSLKRLSEITEWFDNQEEIDVEEGLKKVKEAVELIKVSKKRLKAIENEFEEIKKGIDGDELRSSSPFANARDGEEEKKRE
jgi:exonuclease VII small subunit